MRPASRTVLLCVAALGCGGDDGGTPPGADGAIGDGAPVAADAGPPDAASCATPSIAPSWRQEYEQEIVAKLSGAMPIAPGVTLTDRASVAARDATRAYLQAELTRLGYAAELHGYESGANVFVRLPATVPSDERLGTIVLGAHFDGVANVPAAADDGTGVALVLAAARWLPTLACRQADVILVFFDQEELGLVGSNFFAAKLMADGVAVAAVHIFDMISFDGDGDGALELWSPTPSLQLRYEAAGAQLGIPVLSVTFAASDHTSFLDAGFTTVGVSEEFVSGDHTPHYHTAMDTYDKIDFAYLGAATGLVFTVVGGQIAAP